MQIGSLIECVQTANAFMRSLYYEVKYWPTVGNIYTVRGIIQNEGGVGIQIEEVVNPAYNYIEGTTEGAYDVKWFREVQPPMSISDHLFSHAPETCEA
jgi:hypothetical protein